MLVEVDEKNKGLGDGAINSYGSNVSVELFESIKVIKICDQIGDTFGTADLTAILFY